jgi:hypothetical protein
MSGIRNRELVLSATEKKQEYAGPEAEETDEQNVENLRKKYPWWLGGQGGGEPTAPHEALERRQRHCELSPRKINKSVKCERGQRHHEGSVSDCVKQISQCRCKRACI